MTTSIRSSNEIILNYNLILIFIFIFIFILFFLFINIKKYFNIKNNNENNKQINMKLLPSNIPKHIAVIMDGNRRFGREKHSDALQGHWHGGQTLVDFVQWCMDDGIEILTVYAFSTENWKRDITEVNTLMLIISKYAESFKHEAIAKNIKVKVLSTDFDKLPPNIQSRVHELEEATKNCTRFLVNICLSYGGRADITSACKEITSDVLKGKMKIDDINEESINKYLTTSSIPDPDLMIRTSGEYRISNFLLWQIAYSELYFIPKYWPEITHSDLRDILCEYSSRSRRFGS